MAVASVLQPFSLENHHWLGGGQKSKPFVELPTETFLFSAEEALFDQDVDMGIPRHAYSEIWQRSEVSKIRLQVNHVVVDKLDPETGEKRFKRTVTEIPLDDFLSPQDDVGDEQEEEGLAFENDPDLGIKRMTMRKEDDAIVNMGKENNKDEGFLTTSIVVQDARKGLVSRYFEEPMVLHDKMLGEAAVSMVVEPIFAPDEPCFSGSLPDDIFDESFFSDLMTSPSTDVAGGGGISAEEEGADSGSSDDTSGGIVLDFEELDRLFNDEGNGIAGAANVDIHPDESFEQILAEIRGDEAAGAVSIIGEEDGEESGRPQKLTALVSLNDEKKARAYGLGRLDLDGIVRMTSEEFERFLKSSPKASAFDQSQISLLKSIRRHSRNKLSSTRCRKKKIDGISTLEDDINALKAKKMRLVGEKEKLLAFLSSAGNR